MINDITCQSKYQLSQNPNYPGWEKTYCCHRNRCNLGRISLENHTILIYIMQILAIDL
jgi:hypothetical protein